MPQHLLSRFHGSVPSSINQSIQPDATSKSLRLVGPFAIQANEAFPIGFVIAPTDKSELFSIFASLMDRLGIVQSKQVSRISWLADIARRLLFTSSQAEYE
jgi:hypothetical protein